MKTLNITFDDKEFAKMQKSRENMIKRLVGVKVSWKEFIMNLVALNVVTFDEVKGGLKDDIKNKG